MIEGNQDFYGLGIRLGIYFQVFSTLLTGQVLPEETSGVWDTNSIFVLAVFAAVSKSSVDGTIHYVEAFVMLQLMFMLVLCAFQRGSAYQFTALFQALVKERDARQMKSFLRISRAGEAGRRGLSIAIACYNIWFWFGFKTPDTCNSFVFLFVKMPVQSRSLGLYDTFAVLYLLSIALATCYSVLATTKIAHRAWEERRDVLSSLSKLYYEMARKNRTIDDVIQNTKDPT